MLVKWWLFNTDESQKEGEKVYPESFPRELPRSSNELSGDSGGKDATWEEKKKKFKMRKVLVFTEFF